MRRQRPHQRLFLFGTENLTGTFFPVSMFYRTRRERPRQTRPLFHEVQLGPSVMVRVPTVALPPERPSGLPIGVRDSLFYAICGAHGIDALLRPQSKCLESELFPRESALQCRVTGS